LIILAFFQLAWVEKTQFGRYLAFFFLETFLILPLLDTKIAFLYRSSKIGKKKKVKESNSEKECLSFYFDKVTFFLVLICFSLRQISFSYRFWPILVKKSLWFTCLARIWPFSQTFGRKPAIGTGHPSFCPTYSGTRYRDTFGEGQK